MKRLLDDNPEELERALLRIGTDVRPDGRGKARLLSALAAGSLAGVGASQPAVASWWKTLLATKVGKTAAVGFLVVGTGTTMVALQRQAIETSSATPADVNPIPAQRTAEQPAEQPAALGLETETASDRLQPNSVVHGALEGAVGATPTGSPAISANSGLPAVTTPTGSSLSKAAGERASGKKRRSTASSPQARASEPSALVAEARFVERLRQAVLADQGNVSRLLADYRRQFPNGQLGPEVNKLEAQWRQR